MCGIVGGIAQRNIVPVLLEGLRRLEYRGYDSSGIAILDDNNSLQRVRVLGKIKELAQKIEHSENAFMGNLAIAHNRWATHGVPSELNAHPHISSEQVAVVHNGIIENYQTLRLGQQKKGYVFHSATDTEVIAHAIHSYLATTKDLYTAVKQAVAEFEGAYAVGVISNSFPDTLIAARNGSPLVIGIGIGIGEYFIASDVSALLPVTQRFIFLEDGDIAKITKDKLHIYDQQGRLADRPITQSSLSATTATLGEYKHFMQKEIFEQPQAVVDTLEGRVSKNHVLTTSFGNDAKEIFNKIEQLQIIACGTSYHAGLVAKYWFEDIINMPCQVEVASEYRYRNPALQANTLFVTISQSGETADTLAALHQIKNSLSNQDNKDFFAPILTICNVAESSLTRASDLVFLTHAGPEIGVASTKAFTTQLVSLALLVTSIGNTKNSLDSAQEGLIISGLQKLPSLITKALGHEKIIAKIAAGFADKFHALFLGRGTMYPIAMEGALKLKEISYIHAEAYPAGELKHGPLALIDDKMPVIVVAPLDDLLEKLKSNLQEVKARGGQMIVFEDEDSNINSEECLEIVKVTTSVGRITAPIVFNIALQLLSYHVALIKGTDVDQPRNLAKSVTVE